MMNGLEIPVYLFTGFLGSGKTTFIQELLEGSDFNAGERTLVLLFEEGEVELKPDAFASPEVFIEKLGKEDLDHNKLADLAEEYMIERVIIEYNGMWMLEDLFTSTPENWVIYQEMLFADVGTFMMYNTNMRQLTFNKMQTAELVVFNRFTEDYDRMDFHKLVRVANRRSDICYEYAPDNVYFDDIPDPLPYDMEAPIITIKDEWFAEWYRDLTENQDNYDGKKIKVKGLVARDNTLPDTYLVFGRHVMTCCVEDIQFAGLACVYSKATQFKTGDWVAVDATIKVMEEEIYGEEGPVLICSKIRKCEPADPEVATF